MKKLCESSREHAKNITDFKKEKMLSLTKEELKSHQDAKIRYICGKSVNYQKVSDHCYCTGK